MNLMKHFGDILHSKLPELCISKLFISTYVLCTTRWSARSRERWRLRRFIEHDAEGVTAADQNEELRQSCKDMYSKHEAFRQPH